MADQLEPLSIQDAIKQATAPAGAQPKTNDFASSMNDVFNDANAKFTVPEDVPTSPLRAGGPGVQFYNADDAAKYQLQSDFDAWGFNPNNPANYDRMVAKEDWGSAISKGWDGLKTNFGNTYVGNFTGYGRMVDAIAHLDMSRLMDDESTMIDQAYAQKQMGNKNFVFVKPEEEDDIFGKKFVAESMQSAGFSLGTVAAFGTELLADALITAATAGGGIETFGASIAKFGARLGMETAGKAIGKGVSAVGKVAKGFTEVESLGKGALNAADKGLDVAGKLKGALTSPTIRKEVINDTFEAMTKTMAQLSNPSKIGEWSMKALEKTPLLGTGVKFGKTIRAAAKGGAGASELIGMGLGATRRVMQEYNMASTEANMEAVSSYSDTLDDMVRQYKASNGGDTPSELEFASMRNDAMKSAGANYKTNMSVLLAMNSLQFGNVLNKYGSANKFIRDFMMEGAEDVLAVEGKRILKQGAKEVVKEGVEQAGKQAAKEGVKEAVEQGVKQSFTKLYEKGALGTLGLVGQISRDFGKKEAAYQLGRSFVRNFAKFEALEGLQENIQEASGKAWRDYYAAKHDTAVKTIYDTFSDAIGDQMSKQGFRTFLSGALGGVLSHGPSMIINKTIAKAAEGANSLNYRNDPSQNPATQAQKALKENIANLNAMFEQTSSSTIDKSLFNFANQIHAGKEMTQAAAKNQQYEFTNGRDNALLSAVISAKQTGTVDVLARSFREMGNNMTAEQFENNFGISLSDTKYNSVEDFTNSIGDDIEKYSESIDDVKRNVGDLANPNLYKVGSKEYYLAIHKRRTQEEAVNIISYNMLRGEMTAERVQQLAQEVRANPVLAHSADYVMRVLHNGENLDAEIGNVQSEVTILNEQLKGEGLDPKLKADLEKQLELKKEHLVDLKIWQSYFDKSARKRTAGKESAVEYTSGKFVGKGKKSTFDDQGKLVQEFEPTSEELNDPEVLARFKKLLVNLNNQAGISVQMTDAQAREALSKVTDISRLNNDAKEYMQSVDVLYNPEAFEYATSRMLDGEIKFKINATLKQLSESTDNSIAMIILGYQITDPNEQRAIAQEVFDAVQKSNEYTKLIALIVDPNLGYQSGTYANELFQSLFKKLTDKVREISNRYDKSGATDISDTDYEAFKKDGTVPEDVKQRIAQMLYDRNPLTDKMKEVYDKHKEDIDKMVDALEEEFKRKRDAARGQKIYDNSANSYEGQASKRLYVMENDRRFAEDIEKYYETRDGQVGSLKEMVQKAIENPLTHPYIKEGLKKLVDKIGDDALVKFDSKQTIAPGYYDPKEHLVVLDPELVNSGNVSFEAVMFHELIHYFTSRELNKDTEFTQKIEKMYANAKVFMMANNISTNYYGMSNLDEFLAEAFTNPEFQSQLNKIPGDQGKTMWQSFLDALTKFLKEALNVNVTPSMLTDVMKAVQEFIDDPTYNGAVEFLKNKGLTDAEIQEFSRAEVLSIAEQEGYNKDQNPPASEDSLNKPEEIIPELQQAAEGLTGQETGAVAEIIPPTDSENMTAEEIERQATSLAENDVKENTEALERLTGKGQVGSTVTDVASNEMSGAPDMSQLLAGKLGAGATVNVPIKNGLVQITINDNNVYKEAYVFNVKDGVIVKATHVTRFKNSTEPTADKKTQVANPIETYNNLASNPAYKVDVRDDDKVKETPAQQTTTPDIQAKKAEIEKRREQEIKENVQLLDVNDVRRPNGAIGTQGFDPSTMKDLVKFISGKMGFAIPSELLDKKTDKLKPLIDYIIENQDIKAKILDYITSNPSEISVMPDDSIQFLDGNHRANLLNIIGSAVIPVINQTSKKQIDSKYDAELAALNTESTGEAAIALDEKVSTAPVVTGNIEVKGTEETGLQVVDTQTNTTVAKDIENLDEANKIAQSFNNSVSDVEVAKQILDKLMNGSATPEAIVAFCESAKNSLRSYNNMNKTDLKTLSEYANTPKGMELLTNLAKKKLGIQETKKKTAKVEKKETAAQPDLFNTTNETTNKDLTSESLNTLAKLVMEKATELQQDTTKSSNLVVDTSSILDMIKDVHSCNQ
jgi:hypothetical protein